MSTTSLIDLTRPISFDSAIALLPAKNTIHTIIPTGFSLCGADLQRQEVIDRLADAGEIFRAARDSLLADLGHTLAIEEDGRWLCIETATSSPQD